MEVHFYKELRPLQLPFTGVFEEAYFVDVPASWYIIIADVKQSTAAVNAGRHNDVNLVAAGSLIAALNIAKKYKIEIPFFFGGDGGTLLVPQPILQEVLAGLMLHNKNCIKNFNLEMHVGSLPVNTVYKAGHYLKISKLQIDQTFYKAVIVGDGLHFAERQVKQSDEKEEAIAGVSQLNMDGLECRWDRIKPPAEENEVVCYLIESLHPQKQMQVYRDVLLKIDEIYGKMEKRHPLSPERLKLLLKFDKLKKEMLAKYGKWRLGYFLTTFLRTFLGKYYFRYNWRVNEVSGQEYLAQLIAHADTLTVDGRINTIISGKMDKRLQLVAYLSAQESAGNLLFGHHISRESIMTCYIENRNARHIHFVDGADGGYTEAAKEMKRKLQLLKLHR